ncbi:FAD dependent oxidoreductase [Aaosphaeria arxii CBS 175.79]|uniref:FAD dependent oxidoreductase n=1 Tax=Aaosphaeria arxii CBS 175.79 TaxID=1450172 RepID=A0A6A5XIX9_9PLEO|nr:FAD dependent oxidoreductase [Aaosphaeria arxii CBS 175.79]KAF2012913.1 FAD dependent oxidoreductase [Aaosphaeria arxii CBS 175.79]
MAQNVAQHWRASIPTEPSTRSYWHQQLDSNLEALTEGELPKSADYVIIGSGLTGSLVAYDLARTLPTATSIVVLEARHAASGATGRNGGHIKPGRIAFFNDWKERHGAQVAAAQVALEKANYEETVAFIEQEQLAEEVELVLLQAMDVAMNQQALEKLKTAWENLRRVGADTSDMQFHQEPETAEAVRIPQCLAAVSYPAASVWPYKLATAVLRKAIGLGVKLYTSTPVKSIDKAVYEPFWTIQTPRGSLQAGSIIHATNGYASSILPELTDKLVPCKGHAAAALPPKAYFESPLQNTYGIHWGDDYDYLIQKHHHARPLIYGGRDLVGSGDTFVGVGDSDDSTLNNSIAESLRNFPFETFKDWKSEENETCPGDTQVWSGIMGFTIDDFPFVGRVPGRSGQFISAGYGGSGMARAFLCSKALCQLIRGEEVDKRIPSFYFDLDKRWTTPETISAQIAEWKAMTAESAV